MDSSLADGSAKNTVQDVKAGVEEKEEDENFEKERLRQEVDYITSKVEQLEQKVNEICRFPVSSNRDKIQHSKPSFILRDREREKINLNHGKQQEASRREAGCSKRMAELMRQFGTILRQITQHRWAWPFMTPVDVQGLGLHDYHDVIKKPMDFGTIRRQMDAKDGTGYKNVRDICEDVMLVFKNAMTYNDDQSDVHVMAKTLLQKFEEKWNTLLPKVLEEETRRKQEEADANSREMVDLRLSGETAHEKLGSELDELNEHLEKLRQELAPKCRMMSVEEKRQLGHSLGELTPEDLSKALQIIAQKNPSFRPTEAEVELDIDAQDASTLWRLHSFVKAVLSVQAKTSIAKAQAKTKRKKEICDAIAKNARKRIRKMLS